jgi:hypothetical protein
MDNFFPVMEMNVKSKRAYIVVNKDNVPCLVAFTKREAQKMIDRFPKKRLKQLISFSVPTDWKFETNFLNEDGYPERLSLSEEFIRTHAEPYESESIIF